MSDVPQRPEKLLLLINGGIPDNKLSYVLEQAVAQDQVVCCLSIRNSILTEWSSLTDVNGTFVDLLNHIIPKGSIKVRPSSVRINERLRVQCFRAKQKLGNLNRTGSKIKRSEFLNSWTKITVLSSDFMSAVEYENEIKKMEAEVLDLQRRIEDLNLEVMGMENEIHQSRRRKNYFKQLEPTTIKDFQELSKHQKKRRVEALSTRAKKALWFSRCFGLVLESLSFTDENKEKYSISSSETSASSPDLSIPISTSASNNDSSKSKQFENLCEDDQMKVESILFLMDKFAVGDAFIHELCMVVNGMPKSYLIKQCRDKLNSKCYVKPTPGKEPGAQISFKTALVNKLKLLLSI